MDNRTLSHTSSQPVTGLLLTGGGARAAYQVGVLEAIADVRAACGAINGPNPFPIITGTSAGAINASALACGSDNFDATVRLIANTWRNFHAHDVYRADHLSMLRSGATWMTLLSLGWLLAKWRRVKPRSLLDNTPLHDLLARLVPLERLPELIRQGHMQALAVTASSYSSGDHITFFEGDKRLMPWVRTQRLSVRDKITHAHLLASSAIPFVFPATEIPNTLATAPCARVPRWLRLSTWEPTAFWWLEPGACMSPKPQTTLIPTERIRLLPKLPAMPCPTSFWMHWRWT
jgi:NTE family protein